jgi:hypothetical protein
MWRLVIVTVLLIAISIVVPFAAPSIYFYQADNGLAGYRRPVSSDAAMAQRAVVDSGSAYSEMSDVADDSGTRRRRMANPTYPKEIENLIASLRNRNACVKDYLGPRNIEEKVAQAKRHLKALDDLQYAREEIKKSCPLMWNDGHNEFFDTANQPYRIIVKKLWKTKRTMDLVKNLNRNLNLVREELEKDGVDVSVYGNNITSPGHFSTANKSMLAAEYNLGFIRAIKYFGKKLEGFGLPDDFFSTEALGMDSSRRKLKRILLLTGIMSNIIDNEGYHADKDELRKEGNVDEIEAAIHNFRGNASFRGVIRKLREEIDGRYNRIREKDPSNGMAYGHSPLNKDFLHYMYISLKYDPESEWGYGLQRIFHDIQEELSQLEASPIRLRTDLGDDKDLELWMDLRDLEECGAI